LKWPDIVSRALAVAIAADLATMPIVALMAGEVSLVSVLVNVLVAPASAPITVVGLIAAGLAQLPFDLPATLLLTVVKPFTWWIEHIAAGAYSRPISVIEPTRWVVLPAHGWIVAGLVCGPPRKSFTILAVLMVWGSADFSSKRDPVELTQVHTVN